MYAIATKMVGPCGFLSAINIFFLETCMTTQSSNNTIQQTSSVLNATIEDVNSVQKRVKISVAKDLVTKAFEDSYRELQKKAKLHGFRPGKAPLSVIKKIYGDSVKGDVVDKLINKHLFEALRDKNIVPIASPVVESIEELHSDKDFVFAALVDIMPSVTVEGYKGLKLSVERLEVNEKAVTREVDFLRRRQAKTKTVPAETAAASGHLATIGHKVFHEGQLIENMDVEDFQVALGFSEIFADLENAIIGMKAGETKKSTITLPKEYNDPALSGKPVEFEIHLKSLVELTLPNFDDEFAKDVGYDSAVALKTNMTEQLTKHSEKTRRQKLENLILTELRQKNNFDVPPSLVDQVIDSMIHELNIPDEKEKKKLLKNEDLRRSFRDTAKTKAQNTLILWRIAQQEKLEVSDAAIEKHIKSNMPGTEGWDDKKFSDLVKSLRPRLQEPLLFELALDSVIASGQITDTSVPM
jgi:trigger factor